MSYTGKGMSEKALVLFSGGVDSAVALWLVKRDSPDVELYTLTVNYYRRSSGEMRCAEKLAALAAVKRHIVVEAPYIREIEDMPGSQSLNSGGRVLPSVFIPVKNLLFYSLAAHLAFMVGAKRVVVGHNYEDSKLFPDVASSLIERFNELLRESLPSYGLTVEAPLLEYTKRQVYQMAVELGVPLEYTWSCWRAGEIHCGACDGCLTRRRMFYELGLRDATVYESLNTS